MAVGDGRGSWEAVTKDSEVLQEVGGSPVPGLTQSFILKRMVKSRLTVPGNEAVPRTPTLVFGPLPPNFSFWTYRCLFKCELISVACGFFFF